MKREGVQKRSMSMRRGTDYRNECRNISGKPYASGRVEMDSELTGLGRLVCIAAGILEEMIVFGVLGIRISLTPVPVLLFLGVLFAILTGAALTGADELNTWYKGRAAAHRSVREDIGSDEAKIITLPAGREWTKAS